MKGQRIHYNSAELSWVQANRTLPRKELHIRFVDKFGRTDVSMINLTSLRKRNGWLTGRTGRFERGQTSHNKGKKMPFNPNSARTQFKKGQLPHNTKHCGHERISKDGYSEISIAEKNPHTGYERRYVLKHRHLWEKANGPVPDGMCLKCVDGNKQNTDPDNWECVPRALLPRLNGRFGRDYDIAAPELKPTIMATAKLEHMAREIRKGKHDENKH
ncbi:MAG: HNH endonuclease signature motif containing protein [Pseudoruegeria sp.]